jgi:pyruvate carboxylase subunit B
MIFTAAPKKIRVMFTPFRDGLQSSFGGKVSLKDILPAMEYSAQKAGIRHFEFGGGARYQAPYFYLGEDPFFCMDEMRRAVGPNVDLQILTRSVSGVTLETQQLHVLQLQARLMKKHGTTWDRNFDYMNDADNLVNTGKPIVEAGMHHQVCIAMMGLPFKDETVHTPEFYVNVIREVIAKGLHFDSVCMKDASGTTDPKTCYETAQGLKQLLPPEVPLWMHTHDTASMAISCYMAGIAGGVDGIDVSVRPMASGTVQPDCRSMWHALKGTGYTLDIDVSKMDEIEGLLNAGLEKYEFDPVTTTADARVIGFPMPGGAIGPNVHMMKEAGILHRYGDVLAEFPVVVKAGGAWTSVTPGSQQYWLQAFNNVLYGRWKKISPGYGRAVLGYYGRPPLPPDPEVVRIAAEQLRADPFSGDPLEAALDTLAIADKAIQERNLAVNEENLFLVASAHVAGKDLELNEGIRLLTGKAKISLPLKKKPEETAASQSPPSSIAPQPAVMAAFSGPITTRCTVVEGGVTRNFQVTIEPPGRVAGASPVITHAGRKIPVCSPFEGKVQLVEINVHVGDTIAPGQVVAAVEAMKAKHEVKAPCAGRVLSIDSTVGSDVTIVQPIMTLEG